MRERAFKMIENEDLKNVLKAEFAKSVWTEFGRTEFGPRTEIGPGPSTGPNSVPLRDPLSCEIFSLKFFGSSALK